MARRWIASPLWGCVGVVLIASLVSLGAPRQQAPKFRLGILPIYDLSGEIGESYLDYLQFDIFDELSKSEIEPVFLNPGGDYTPQDLDFVSEYTQKAEVDLALISSFLPSERPKKGDWILRVETKLFAPGGTEAGTPAVDTILVDREYLQKGLDYGLAHYGFYLPSRPFEKQPLGKAARKLAQQVTARVLEDTRGIEPKGLGPGLPGNQDACTVDFRIYFTSKKSPSKAFTLAVNGREESATLKDATISVDLVSGPVTIITTLQDVPYKLPAQKTYMANTNLDCSLPQHQLVLEIGASGEGFLKQE
ncbi:MAG: hypothetical protein WBP79_00310 [Candidatus Acidiferrales bacterium]